MDHDTKKSRDLDLLGPHNNFFRKKSLELNPMTLARTKTHFLLQTRALKPSPIPTPLSIVVNIWGFPVFVFEACPYLALLPKEGGAVSLWQMQTAELAWVLLALPWASFLLVGLIGDQQIWDGDFLRRSKTNGDPLRQVMELLGSASGTLPTFSSKNFNLQSKADFDWTTLLNVYLVIGQWYLSQIGRFRYVALVIKCIYGLMQSFAIWHFECCEG